MRRVALPLAILVAGCVSSEDDVARGAAQSVVSRAALKQLPAGVPVGVYTDCVVDHATPQQVLALAADSLVGPTASTYEIMAQITAKPETFQCLAANGVPALLQ